MVDSLKLEVRPAQWKVLSSAHTAAEITIVTPYFETGSVLRETVAAVRAQTLVHWRWFIVDDGSLKCGARKVLDAAAVSDPRIFLIELDSNVGTGGARNAGLAKVETEFVAFLDSDDLIEPTFLEKSLLALKINSSWSFVNSHTQAFGFREYVWTQGFQGGAEFLRQNLVCPIVVMRTRDALELGGFDTELREGLEDWDFWLKAAANGKWGGTIPETLTWYRTREQQGDRWRNIRESSHFARTAQSLRNRYPRLNRSSFPQPSAGGGELVSLARSATRPDRACVVLLLPHLEMGGADRLNLDLTNALKAVYDVEVIIITTRASDDPWLARFHRLTPYIYRLSRLGSAEFHPEFVDSILKRWRPEAIFLSHSESGYLMLGWIKQRNPMIPVVDLVHMATESWKDGGFPRYSILYSRFLDHTIATSEWLKKWMSDRGGDPNDISVVYTGIDVADWSPASLASSPSVIRLCFLGRFCEQKNVKALPSIVQGLKEKGVEFALSVAGGGPDRVLLDQLLFKPHSDVCRYVGALPPDQIKGFLRDHDVLVLPSVEEGIALVLFEAMACRLAVIATDVGGQAELLTPEAGILVPFDGDLIKNFVREIELLSVDRARLDRIRTGARNRVVTSFQIAPCMKSIADVCLKHHSLVRTAEPCASLAEIKRALMGLQMNVVPKDEWERAVDRNIGLRWIRAISELVRGLPWIGRMFIQIEHRHGEALGARLLRWTKRNASIDKRPEN
jgi:glycosyltransferase involved in cell wall biosynthesis/GT2 family glycosyltransferase